MQVYFISKYNWLRSKKIFILLLSFVCLQEKKELKIMKYWMINCKLDLKEKKKRRLWKNKWLTFNTINYAFIF